MDFTLDGRAQGAQAAGAGMGNAIKAIFGAPYARQSAEQDTALKLANIYRANMTGNKAGEEARGLSMTNDLRSGVDNEIAANPDMPAYEKAVRVAFKMAGPQHMQNWSKSGQMEQQIADIEAIKKNPELALPASQAYFATSGKAPFDNVGNTGRSINNLSGQQFDANAVMAKLFDGVQSSVANENNAQAGAASALKQQRLNNPDGVEGGREIQRQKFDLANYNAAYPVNTMTGERRLPKGTNPEIHLREYLDAAARSRGVNKDPQNPEPSAKINPSKPFTPTREMIDVQAQYHAGNITKEQAKQKLKSLGMSE